MSRSRENTSFICIGCGKEIEPHTGGSYRNHSPFCLCSLHLDNVPGDRKNSCGGRMKAISVKWNSRKGYQLLHKCEICGFERLNKVALDTEQPDDFELILKLMSKIG